MWLQYRKERKSQETSVLRASIWHRRIKGKGWYIPMAFLLKSLRGEKVMASKWERLAERSAMQFCAISTGHYSPIADS